MCHFRIRDGLWCRCLKPYIDLSQHPVKVCTCGHKKSVHAAENGHGTSHTGRCYAEMVRWDFGMERVYCPCTTFAPLPTEPSPTGEEQAP